MDELLSKINIRIRRYKPVVRKGELYTEWRENNIIQVTYRSRGCYNSLLGSCMMCDYGIGKNLTLAEAKTVLPKVLEKGHAGVEELILNTYGSFLDEYEMPRENFRAILEQVASTDIPYITFETHYKTISEEKIEEIQSYLENKIIAYEMGLESINPYVLEKCLNKEIDLTELKRCIKLIHDHNHTVILNILYGSPFLNAQQQIEDTLQSVFWAYEQGAEVIVLFPVNIKPFTALEHLYKGGFYKPVSQWGFIKLLDSIPLEILGKISIAWYGNREIKYKNYKFNTIFPKDCSKCHSIIFEFYSKFSADRNADNRKRMLKEIISVNTGCSCREQTLEMIEHTESTENLRQNAYEYLRKNVLKDGKYAIPWKKY